MWRRIKTTSCCDATAEWFVSNVVVVCLAAPTRLKSGPGGLCRPGEDEDEVRERGGVCLVCQHQVPLLLYVQSLFAQPCNEEATTVAATCAVHR